MPGDEPNYRAALAAMGPIRPMFVAPPPGFWQWLADHGIPANIAEFLFENAIAVETPFRSGCGGIWTPDDVMALNEQESELLTAGLLAVGNTTNGDFIVLDLTKDAVGFVSHDELWEPTAGRTSAREIYAPVDRTLAALLIGMTAEDERWRTHHDWERIEYPIDYCTALKLGPQ